MLKLVTVLEIKGGLLEPNIKINNIKSKIRLRK